MSNFRTGHAPGHIRSAFIGAVEAFLAWKPGEPEPVVDVEIHYEPHSTLIRRVCGLVWNCNDIVPGDTFRELKVGCGLAIGRQTYAACARAMKTEIERLAVAA